MEGVYGILAGTALRNSSLGDVIEFAPMTGAEYAGEVPIIARSTLNTFVRNRVEPRQQRVVQDQLDAWYGLVSRAAWKNSAELKQQHRTASIVSSERAVFNIKGNEFRLVVAVDYEHGFVLVVWLGTHREYDEIDVKQVRYDEERYADSTGSN
jgi:mRNA interferase HigB